MRISPPILFPCSFVACITFLPEQDGPSEEPPASDTGMASASEVTDTPDSDADSGSPAVSAWNIVDLVVDAGVRMPCATIPRVGRADGLTWLYHDNKLVSASGMNVATSVDGLSFGAPSVSPSRFQGSQDQVDRTGFPDVVELPVPTDACGGAPWRIYLANMTQGSFGDGIASRCSTDNQWFGMESDTRFDPPEGAKFGVVGAYAVSDAVFLLTMNGVAFEDHRIWQYRSTDPTGDTFELFDDDPLGQGTISAANPRHNDPFLNPLTDGGHGMTTMYSTHGDPPPPSERAGAIYAWQIDDSAPSVVLPAHPDSLGDNQPVLTHDQLLDAGHDVWSVNDPVFNQLQDGRTRVFFGAMLALSSYPNEPDLQTCKFDRDGTEFAWAILSATSP